MATIGINITANSAQAQQNLNQLATAINNFAKQLANTTPQADALGRAFQKVQSDFSAGKISLEQARVQMQALSAEAQNLGGKLEQSGKGAQGMGLQFTELKSKLDLALGTLRAIGEVATEAFNFAKLGAQVTQMSESFGTLIEVVGAAPDLLEQLQDAAGGTIPDLTLMSSTAKLLAGTTGDLASSMAAAAPRLLEIARAAVKLDPTLGSVEEVFQSLATGIKRNSPLLIDNANIVVRLGQANEKLAEQLGKSVEEFTDADRAMALLNATLDGGAKLIEQVGGTVESETDKFAQLTTALTNLKNAGAVLAADFLTPTITGLSDVAVALADGQGVWDTYWEAVGKFNAEAVGGVVEFAGQLATSIEDTAANLLNLNPAIEQTSTAFHNLSDAQLDNLNATVELGNSWGMLGEAGTDLEDTYANQHLAIQENIEDYETAADAAAAYEARLQAVNARAAEMIEQAQDAGPKIQELNDILNQDVGSPLASFIEDINFFIASGGRDFAAEFEALQQTLAETIAAENTTPGQAALAMQDAKEKAGELLAEYLTLQVELGKETEIGAATALSETLGVSVDEANLLLLDFDANADEVFGKDRAVLLDTTSLDDLHEKLSNAGEDLAELDGAEEVLEPISSGLNQVASDAEAAASAMQHLQQVISSIDTSKISPFIAESPPPLGEGLEYINDALVYTVAGLRSLGSAINNIGGGTGGDGLAGFFEEARAQAEEFVEILYDAANAFGNLGNAASDLFQEQTLDPLLTQLAQVDQQIEDIMAGQTIDMYQLATLTAQRADLAGRIADEEERILRLQQQQQQLDFLSQQFELLKFLEEHNIDPSSVLNGASLGANADPAALIEAMSRALQQVLDQLAGQLGGLGFANGANFVVPPGYANDSYGPLWVSSGEHVNVTPAGQMGSGTQVVINMSGAIIASQQEANRMMRSALDAAGVRANIIQRGY